MRSRHYLNWAAVGVPPLRAVGAVRSVLDAVESSPEAASSPEAVGAAKEEARAQLAPLLGCSPEQVVFTGTSTTLDFVAIGSQKWLMAPYGVGALCVRKRRWRSSAFPGPAT
jgi:selenocysteine lyase/cysteine desulfurase